MHDETSNRAYGAGRLLEVLKLPVQRTSGRVQNSQTTIPSIWIPQINDAYQSGSFSASTCHTSRKWIWIFSRLASGTQPPNHQQRNEAEGVMCRKKKTSRKSLLWALVGQADRYLCSRLHQRGLRRRWRLAQNWEGVKKRIIECGLPRNHLF